jgi:hypothetical protein
MEALALRVVHGVWAAKSLGAHPRSAGQEQEHHEKAADHDPSYEQEPGRHEVRCGFSNDRGAGRRVARGRRTGKRRTDGLPGSRCSRCKAYAGWFGRHSWRARWSWSWTGCPRWYGDVCGRELPRLHKSLARCVQHRAGVRLDSGRVLRSILWGTTSYPLAQKADDSAHYFKAFSDQLQQHLVVQRWSSGAQPVVYNDFGHDRDQLGVDLKAPHPALVSPGFLGGRRHQVC